MIETLAITKPVETIEHLTVEERSLVERTDVMTGDRDRRMFLYYQLVGSIQKSVRIDIIVSFLMESGVRMLLKDM